MAVARERFASFGYVLPLMQSSVDDLPYPDESFDAVTCIGLLMHLDADARVQALRELARVSRGPVVVQYGCTDGAQLVSTDYEQPDPTLKNGYTVRIPDGTPARCDPVTAPLRPPLFLPVSALLGVPAAPWAAVPRPVNLRQERSPTHDAGERTPPGRDVQEDHGREHAEERMRDPPEVLGIAWVSHSLDPPYDSPGFETDPLW